MGAPQLLSSLSCELRILRAKNIEIKSNRNLFVRCYLSASARSDNRVRLDSQEISAAKSDLCWNKSFSLECLGTQGSVEMLMQETIVFELRYRSTVPVLGRTIGGSSHLLGRAEIPWKTVSESPAMEIEKWVVMVSRNRRVVEDLKPPALQVAMKVQVDPAVKENMLGRRRRRESRLKTMDQDDCGCMETGCNCAEDYDIFVLAAALEAL